MYPVGTHLSQIVLLAHQKHLLSHLQSTLLLVTLRAGDMTKVCWSNTGYVFLFNMGIVQINTRTITPMTTDRRFYTVVDYAGLTPQKISATILQMNVPANSTTVKYIQFLEGNQCRIMYVLSICFLEGNSFLSSLISVVLCSLFISSSYLYCYHY